MKQTRGRAKSTGEDQGQWSDDNQAAEFFKENFDIEGTKPKEVELPQGMGEAIKPDGSAVNATHAKIIKKRDGTIRTAYPIVKQLLCSTWQSASRPNPT